MIVSKRSTYQAKQMFLEAMLKNRWYWYCGRLSTSYTELSIFWLCYLVTGARKILRENVRIDTTHIHASLETTASTFHNNHHHKL